MQKPPESRRLARSDIYRFSWCLHHNGGEDHNLGGQSGDAGRQLLKDTHFLLPYVAGQERLGPHLLRCNIISTAKVDNISAENAIAHIKEGSQKGLRLIGTRHFFRPVRLGMTVVAPIFLVQLLDRVFGPVAPGESDQAIDLGFQTIVILL